MDLENTMEQEKKRGKKDTLRMSFVFSQEDWESLGFAHRPTALEMKQAVYSLIHTIEPEELPPVMGTSTVAQLLGMNQQTVKMWAQRGEIPATKISGRWRFSREDVLEYMKEHSGKAAQARKIEAREKEREQLRKELREIRRRHH